MRYRRRCVGAVKPVRKFGIIIDNRRKLMILSSQTVNELEANAAACRIMGAGKDLRLESERDGFDRGMTASTDMSAAENITGCVVSKPASCR